MSDAILITGASGFIGSWLVRFLLERHRDAEFLLLARPTSRMESAALESGRVSFVAGDVSLPGLGLADSSISRRVTEVFHAAAHTKFSAPPEELSAVNVLGTEQVIHFAEICPRLRRLHYVSTAFVSGKRRGTILETELDEGQDFSNSYERSKLAAETLVRRCGARLPVTVYRPSIVMGDSVTGSTPHFKGIYQIMRASFAGLLEFVPADPAYRPDVVPVDFVARAMVEIAAAPGSEGQTFHLTAGQEGRMSIGEMFDCWIERTASHGIEVRRPVFDVSEPAGGVARRRWARMMEHLTPYLGCPAMFDRRQAEAFLGPVQCPPMASYFERLIDFGIACRFDPPGDGVGRPSGDAVVHVAAV